MLALTQFGGIMPVPFMTARMCDAAAGIRVPVALSLRRPRIEAAFISMTVIALHADAVHAQAIDTVTQQASEHISVAFSYALNTICFVGGGILLAMAIFGWWQHQRNPNAGSRPTMVLAGFICGGLLLAFPFVARTASFTVFGQGPSATGAQQQMQFNQ
jgi:hypothetical protein